MAQTYSSLAALLEQESIPGPGETLTTLLDNLRSRQGGEYDLTKIAMATWVEALRRPEMHDVVHQFYANITGLFTELTQRWIRDGTLAEDTDPHALPSLFVTLMPGMIVMSHLYELPTAELLAQGMGDFPSVMGSCSGPQPRHG